MTTDLSHTDRIYKVIDAQIGNDEFMRILSKIDSDQKVTIEFYFYSEKDIDKKCGVIEDKEDIYIMEPIDVSEFDEIIAKFPLIFHEFRILATRDLSNLALDEAMKEIKSIGYENDMY
jgi:hypothetical protein